MRHPLRVSRATQLSLLALWMVAAWSSPAYCELLLYDSGKRQLQVNISDEFPTQTQDEIDAWVRDLSHSLTLVYGHWPRERWAIDVVPVSGSSDDPIPWAQVHREGMDRVAFYVLANATSDRLKRAWTGYHELSHLLLPYRGWGDTWFSEGLASYYQNILQARAGIISETQMWQKLHDGFMRGRSDSRFDGMSLLSVNRNMRANGGYMRVYWSGAWYFLSADLSLREQSNGSHSLDNALEQLNACCARKSLSVTDIIDQMDRGNQRKVFEPLYREVRAAEQMPPFEPLFDRLGIRIVEGKVTLQQQGPEAELRRQFLHSTAL
jgi:M61 glycyl aminopeptidase